MLRSRGFTVDLLKIDYFANYVVVNYLSVTGSVFNLVYVA